AVLAPLATYYSLALDALVAPEHRAEVFAQLRTANALGIITSSALLSLASLQTTFTVVIALITTVLLLAALVFTAGWVQARSSGPRTGTHSSSSTTTSSRRAVSGYRECCARHPGRARRRRRHDARTPRPGAGGRLRHRGRHELLPAPAAARRDPPGRLLLPGDGRQGREPGGGRGPRGSAGALRGVRGRGHVRPGGA